MNKLCVFVSTVAAVLLVNFQQVETFTYFKTNEVVPQFLKGFKDRQIRCEAGEGNSKLRFRVVNPGLTKKTGQVSLMSEKYDDYFISSISGNAYLLKAEATADFAKSATFVLNMNSERKGPVSFQSLQHPGHVLLCGGGVLVVRQPPDTTERGRALFTSDTDINPCRPNPCQNGGTCHIFGTKYTCNCESNYSGKNCDKFINPCSSEPCGKGGICQKLFSGYRCDCLRHYTGKNCETYNNPCLPNPCKNYGRCDLTRTGFECKCTTKYAGKYCETIINPCSSEPCGKGGICQKLSSGYRCDCLHRYTGKNCETYYLCPYNPCQNGGKCDTSGFTRECTCPKRYIGKYCETYYDPCLPNPCRNGGRCSDSESEIECACPTYFSGKYCEVYNDQCLNNPCQNGGECYISEFEQMCRCPNPYTGKYCETYSNPCLPNPCRNGGSCKNLGSEIVCTCPTYYSGVYCEAYTDTCITNPCQNGGECNKSPTGYWCACANYYTGRNCETHTDSCLPNPCRNLGRCHVQGNGYVCLCQSGYTGNNCEAYLDPCWSSPCRNGGTCDPLGNGYMCTCTKGFSGSHCESPNPVQSQQILGDNTCWPNPCQNGGWCNKLEVGYMCTCAKGFSGLHCESSSPARSQQILGDNTCWPNPCQNGGWCDKLGIGYQCICPNGYTGTNCEGLLTTCSFNPCQNSGTCQQIGTGNKCSCADDGSSRICETWQSCHLQPCGNGGSCNEIICKCAAGYYGNRCENKLQINTWSPCSRSCGGGTRYKAEHCFQNDATRCPRKYEECNTHTCYYGARCTSHLNKTSGYGTGQVIDWRVIGGIQSKPREWPWSVAIYYKPTHTFFCGGSLVNHEWIVTAAHCVKEKHRVYLPSVLKVLVGSNTRERPTAGHRWVDVINIIYHHTFKRETYVNDVAVLKLNAYLTYSDVIKPISLPKEEQVDEDTTCYALGWGSDTPIGRSAVNSLRHVALRILPLDACLQSHPRQHNDGIICAGHLPGGKDTCKGDSGGPLLCRRRYSCEWYLAGITSYGAITCGVAGFPATYTNVAKYEIWIKQQINGI